MSTPPITQTVDTRVRFTVAADPVAGLRDFSDGLYYDALPDQSQITADEQSRYASWVNLMANPSPQPPPPSDADLQTIVTDQGAQTTQLVAQMASTTNQLNAIAEVVSQAVTWLETLPLNQAQVQNVASFMETQIISMSKLLTKNQQKTVLNSIIAALQAAVPS